MNEAMKKRNLRRILIGGAVAASALAFFASCGKRAGEPAAKPTGPAEPAPAQVAGPEASVHATSQRVGLVQAPVRQPTGAVESAAVSVSNQIPALRAEIMETAGRRGSVAGRLEELRRRAMTGDDPEIKSINEAIRSRREALTKKLGELPEVVDMKRAVDEIEKKKKDLLAQRSSIFERKSKGGADDGSATNSVEQLKTLEAGLRGLQKELQTALTEHRKLVQEAKEKNQDINALSAEISEKEVALVERLNSLPGIKELRTEQAELESRLRDLKIKLRMLENSQSAAKQLPQAAPGPAAAQPK